MDTIQAGNYEHHKYNEFMRFMNKVSDGDVKIENSQQAINSWNDFAPETSEAGATASSTSAQGSDWVRDFAEHKAKQGNI